MLVLRFHQTKIIPHGTNALLYSFPKDPHTKSYGVEKIVGNSVCLGMLNFQNNEIALRSLDAPLKALKKKTASDSCSSECS